jgi:hypothetical protein
VCCWAVQTEGAPDARPLPASAPRLNTRTYDVVSLGNLCVDIVLPIDPVRGRCRTSSWQFCHLTMVSSRRHKRQIAEHVHCTQMPPLEVIKTPEYLAALTAAPPPQRTWEVGASCNFLIAAARLGMRVGAVANLGDDAYGAFLRNVLRVRFLHLSLIFQDSHWRFALPAWLPLCCAPAAVLLRVKAACSLAQPARLPCTGRSPGARAAALTCCFCPGAAGK